MHKISSKWPVIALSIGWGISLGFLLFFVQFALFTWIHEGAHVIVGCSGSFILVQSCSFNISHWQTIEGITVPQQTQMLTPTFVMPFRFAGVAIVIAIVWIILRALCKRYKLNKTGLTLIFLGFVGWEIVANSLCGTDNWTGDALGICYPLVRESVGIVTLTLFCLGSFLLVRKYLDKKSDL